MPRPGSGRVESDFEMAQSSPHPACNLYWEEVNRAKSALLSLQDTFLSAKLSVEVSDLVVGDSADLKHTPFRTKSH